jgi:integrase/recombinase XerD
MSAPVGKRLIESFLDALAAERGASPNTLQAYAHDLGDYIDVLDQRATDALKA